MERYFFENIAQVRSEPELSGDFLQTLINGDPFVIKK
jgi:hypothetical protein